MQEADINVLLKKAEELKALFVLGQRVIPFMEEIFIFIKETSPLLDEISSSIHENLQKMPKASKQLSKVTEATESATNEIMDTVDGVVYKSGIIATNLAQIKTLANGDETITAEEFLRLVNNSEELLKSIKRDSQGIMIALQVQDITSQQIAAVNSVLDAVQTRLAKITRRLEAVEFADLVHTATGRSEQHVHSTSSSVSTLHRAVAFDPDAVDSLANNMARQAEVDALFSGDTPPSSPEEAEDSDEIDIDALFASAPMQSEEKPTPTSTPVAAPEPPATESAPSAPADASDASDDDPFSQDDIDALFK